jgi:hypothetical protein
LEWIFWELGLDIGTKGNYNKTIEGELTVQTRSPVRNGSSVWRIGMCACFPLLINLAEHGRKEKNEARRFDFKSANDCAD